MQIGSKVVCAYAVGTELRTHKSYEVASILSNGEIELKELDGNKQYLIHSYPQKLFMLQDEMIKQVLENAKHG